MNFSDLRAIDKRLNEVAHRIEAAAPDSLKGTRFEKTAHVLSNLSGSAGYLKDGFLDLVASGNAYAAFALFRVFLEHILKAFAVFQKALHDGTDEFADKYAGQIVAEAARYLKAIDAAKLDPSVAEHSALAPVFDEARELSSGEIHKLEEPFQHKKLITTIRESLKMTDATNFLLKIIPNYCELSGFVHGGPSTADILHKRARESSLDEEFLELSALVIRMRYSAQLWILEFAAVGMPEFVKYRDALDAAISEFDQTPDSESPE
jgi:hypothetical protein